ncbi:hypothetical protein JNM87_00925 [Candidatus Saccharibacteria bacterium]|nr:hypothetical protein [Candidatus Saccharibacteria bacterium]
MFAGILVWFGLFFWVVAIFKFIGGLFKKAGSPVSVAKMQKKMYDVNKRQNPNASKEELRLMTVSARAGFKKPDELLRLTAYTTKVAEKLEHPNNFQTMVYVMITMEFKDLNQNLNMSPDELLDEVCKVIPTSY